LIRTPFKILKKLFEQTLRSCLFLLLSYHGPSRIHCLYRALLNYYHRVFRKDKYSIIAPNLLSVMMVTCFIGGGVCILFEASESKRTDIALFTFWRVVEQCILIKCDIKSGEKDYDHPFLGSNYLPAIMFGIACGLNVFVHISNPKALKSLEKSVLKYALA